MLVTVFRSRVRAGHRKAQQLGRERFYSGFSIHVCEVLKSNAFKQPPGGCPEESS